MSLSKPRESMSPVTRWFRVKGGSGEIAYFDKEAEKEVSVDLPFEVIVLDVLSTITGYHSASKSGFSSNEFRRMSDEIRVRTKDGIVAAGAYSDIKDRLRSMGAKFASSVYVAYRGDSGEWQLGNIRLSGAAIGPWIDYRNNVVLDYEPGVAIVGFRLEKSGVTEYYVPEFEGWDVPKADLEAAIALDEGLQTWLENRSNSDSRFERSPQRPSRAPSQPAFSAPTFDDDEPPF